MTHGYGSLHIAVHAVHKDYNDHFGRLSCQKRYVKKYLNLSPTPQVRFYTSVCVNFCPRVYLFVLLQNRLNLGLDLLCKLNKPNKTVM